MSKLYRPPGDVVGISQVVQSGCLLQLLMANCKHTNVNLHRTLQCREYTGEARTNCSVDVICDIREYYCHGDTIQY